MKFFKKKFKSKIMPPWACGCCMNCGGFLPIDEELHDYYAAIKREKLEWEKKNKK